MLVWILLLLSSLIVMIKGANWFLDSAEKIGIAMGIPLFVVGVVITGIGTSLPELLSSLFAVIKNAPEIVAANAVGSNIANILLIIGISALIGKKLSVRRNLINLEIPLLTASTAIFIGVAYDGVVNKPESIILIVAGITYFFYILTHKDSIETGESEAALIRTAKKAGKFDKKNKHIKITPRDILVLLIGGAGLMFGAQYLIESIISLAKILNIATGVIAISVIAVGTSLPELLVSIKSVLRGKNEVALGNIFGSNAFNLLIVIGIPGLITNLPIDKPTMEIGLPFLFGATFLLIISGISRKIHNWEGVFYLLFYVVFSAKLFDLF